MNAFFAIVRKELRSITRERTILIAILIQLFIASFSSALLLGLLSVYDPDSFTATNNVSIRVGLINTHDDVLAQFLRDRKLRVQVAPPSANPGNAFASSPVDVVLMVPPETSGAVEIKMYLPRSETLASFAMIILREPFKHYENYLRQERGVTVNYTDIPGLPDTTFQFLYSVIVPLLMLFPAFVAGSIVIDSLSEELETHTLETLLSAPLSLSTVFAAKISTALVVAFVQCVMWLALLRLNAIEIDNLWLVLLLAILAAALNITVSAFAATILRDRERSQFIYAVFIVLMTSTSYFFDAAPIQTITRLAIGDYYTGIPDVAKYAFALGVMLFLLFTSTRRVKAV